MNEPILEAKAVSKEFPVRGGVFRRVVGTVHAVRDVTLAIHPGEAVGLVGESGCGKSTLARMLVGLLSPSSGEIRLAGQPRSGLRGQALHRAHRAAQMIFQDPTGSLNPRMTVEDIVAEPLVIHRLAADRAQRRHRVDKLLACVQLPSGYRSRLPWQLSGGERQRVGIARALAAEPQALICDEPIASLDVSVGAQILHLLGRLRAEQGLALLLISHDLHVVASVCERIAVMAAGRLVEVGPTQQVVNAPADPYTALLLRCAALDLDAVDER